MIALASELGQATLRALGATLDLSVAGVSHLEALRASRRPFLFVVWHGRLLIPVLRHRGQGVVAMVSRSRDGDLTARLLGRLGYATVRGSSSRGGNQAYHELRAELEAGRAGAIIPDGPRGPARELKPGVLHLAAAAAAPILPLAASARPCLRLRSWDRLLLPLPFARAALVYGAPLEVPRGLGPDAVEALRAGLEATLDDLEREADARVGLDRRPSAVVDHVGG